MATSTQRTAAVWAGVTVLLAVAACVFILATPPDAGANIGAGLVVLLAMVGSFVTAVLLLRTGQRDAVPVAGVSAAAWVVYIVLAADDTGPGWLAVALIAVAVLVPAAWAVRTLIDSRRS